VQPADELEELKEEADEARRLAEEWEAKYKVGRRGQDAGRGVGAKYKVG
jgi:hypothetical protein